jgi:hypothetical protein
MATVTICPGSKKIPVTFTRYFGTGLFKSDRRNSDDPKIKRLSFYIESLHKTSATNYKILVAVMSLLLQKKNAT